MLLLWENRMLSPGAEAHVVAFQAVGWRGEANPTLLSLPHSPEGKSQRLHGWRLRVELSLVAVNPECPAGAWALAGPRWAHCSRSQSRERPWALTSSECLLWARHWVRGWTRFCFSPVG